MWPPLDPNFDLAHFHRNTIESRLPLATTANLVNVYDRNNRRSTSWSTYPRLRKIRDGNVYAVSHNSVVGNLGRHLLSLIQIYLSGEVADSFSIRIPEMKFGSFLEIWQGQFLMTTGYNYLSLRNMLFSFGTHIKWMWLFFSRREH